MPALAVTTDLSDFPGAPFPESFVESASQAVRAEAGWHIAPAVTETLTVDSDGAAVLFLPTLLLTEVVEVRDVSGNAPKVLTGWRKSRAGMLSRVGGWPTGFEVLEVDVVHGHSECPPELLPVIAEVARAAKQGGRVAQESLGSRSISLTLDPTLASVLARFKLPPRP